MNEIEAINWQLGHYHAVLAKQADRLYNALEELQRTTLFLLNLECSVSDEKIDEWLSNEGFIIDDDGFFQSQKSLIAFRNGKALDNSISYSWGKHLFDDNIARRHMYTHRNIGNHLKHIYERLGEVCWIYYQDASNTALQYPYIDQRTAITHDFDWKSYHTYISVCPENNPDKKIEWTLPTIDYAGKGLILSVSIPVWKNDNFIGLWSIDLPIRYLYRDFALSKSFPEQMQFIINKDGMLILHEKLQAEIDKTRGQVLLHPISELGDYWSKLNLEIIKEKQDGILDLKDDENKEWIFCYCFVKGIEWTLFCGLPKLSMEESAAKRLSDAFRQIADGNFSCRIESLSSNNLSTLVDEFNKMTLRLSNAEKLRQDIENQLLKAQKMEAVGRLAGGIAHDYNNMTNVIMGYAELVLEKLDKSNPMYAHLLQIQDAAKKSMELTKQLLAFARCQAIAPKVLNINQAVDNLLTMLKRLIGEDIELLWHSEEHAWPTLIDPTQVDQILVNLCVNARDAISGIGTITIETSNVEFDDSYCTLNRGFIKGEFLQLTVSDDGIGMDAATIDKIFEPFYSTKVIGHGTGLGLATVYGIVKQNKGFINVYSEVGKGTSFKIYLPRVIGQYSEKISVNTSEISKGKNETLLVVEDNEAILTMIEMMLKQLGYTVLITRSPFEAIEIAEHYPDKIDLLLTDVVMPELNGKDLAKRLQEKNDKLLVLFMSGYTSNIIVHRGVLDKDVSMIEKPFSKKELAAKIREIITKAHKVEE